MGGYLANSDDCAVGDSVLQHPDLLGALGVGKVDAAIPRFSARVSHLPLVVH